MNAGQIRKDPYTIELVQELHSLQVIISEAGEERCCVSLPNVSARNCLLYKDALFFHTGSRVGKLRLPAEKEAPAVQWLELYPSEPKSSEPGGYYYPGIEQRLYTSKEGSRLVLRTHYQEYDPAAVDESLMRSCYRIRVLQPEEFRIEKEICSQSPDPGEYAPDIY